METMQPWATGFNRPKPLPTQMSIQRSQSSPLSREEQLEARRPAEESNFSYAGYQVVRREFVSHRFDPAMTVRVNSITFNNACIKALENATYVQFLINPTEKKLQAAAECLGMSLEYLLGKETKKDPAAQSDEVSEDAIKFALFGGTCTDAQYEEVKQFARFRKERDARDTK